MFVIVVETARRGWDRVPSDLHSEKNHGEAKKGQNGRKAKVLKKPENAKKSEAGFPAGKKKCTQGIQSEKVKMISVAINEHN